MKTALALSAFPVLLIAAVAADARPLREWDWRMPANVYKNLDFTDRAAVDRATKLFQQAVDAEERGTKVTDLVPRYRAAAGEWRKVQVQGETSGGDEALLAYAVFMQGYAKQQAHDRNEAIKFYNETLDIYEDQSWIALPARYMLATAKASMGDVRASNADLDEIVAMTKENRNPLWLLAVNARADHLYDEKKFDEALELWRQIAEIRDFRPNSPQDGIRDRACRKAVALAIARGDVASAMELAFSDVDRAQKGAMARAILDRAPRLARQSGFQGLENDFFKGLYPKEGARKDAIARAGKGFRTWFDSQFHFIEEAGFAWDAELLRLTLFRGNESQEDVMRHVNRLRDILRGTKDARTRNDRARTLALELASRDMAPLAREISAVVEGRTARLWLDYDIGCRSQQWKAAIACAEEIVAMKPAPEPDDVNRAKWAIADICLRRIGDFERAIRAYTDINEPPRSLWPLADAYRAAGKKDLGYRTLTELASLFPDEAPDAVLRTAQWREQDGQREKAIAAYRSLMKHPKWKQSGASSRAHQALERLGIATGGAMTNEVR